MNVHQLYDGHSKKEVKLTHSRKTMPFGIQLDVEKRLEGSAPDTHTFCYKGLHKSLTQLPSDVSSPIGLFIDIPKEYEIRENERLERCLADLFISMLFPHFKEPGTFILIQGPPLPKLIGRIGYRFPCPEITIAFVTVDDCFMNVPNCASDSGNIWDGPFPNLHEDSITRTFYFQHKERRQVRVDLFCQGLGQFDVNECSNGIPLGILAKLDACKEAIKEFSSDLLKREKERIPESSPKGSDLFGMTELGSQEHGFPVAARSQSSKKSTSPNGPNVLADFRNVNADLSDEEIYRGILGPSEKQLQNSSKVSEFLLKHDLGPLQKNVEFLRFIKGKFDGKKIRNPLNENKLIMLFKEYSSGAANESE